MIFGKLINTNEFEWSKLLADLQRIQSLPKYHKLHREGTICNHIFLVEQRIVRSFYLKDGKDITAHFEIENRFITAIDSFIQRKPSRYNIELLEDSEIGFISFQDIENLLEEKPVYEKYMRYHLELYIELVERVENLMFHNAKERYAKLVSNQPSLLQRVNLNHIASFLGITQETLSRIRKAP